MSTRPLYNRLTTVRPSIVSASRSFLLNKPLSQIAARYSAMAGQGVPVIVCGLREEIGRSVGEALSPEFELVHFVSSTGAGVAELPLILQGILPEKIASNVGSGNISGLAKAVILGGGYETPDYEAMKAAVDKAELQHRPVWLRKDGETDKTGPPPGPEYGKYIAGRVKDLLEKLNKEGKLDGKDGQLYWF